GVSPAPPPLPSPRGSVGSPASGGGGPAPRACTDAVRAAYIVWGWRSIVGDPLSSSGSGFDAIIDSTPNEVQAAPPPPPPAAKPKPGDSASYTKIMASFTLPLEPAPAQSPGDLAEA